MINMRIEPFLLERWFAKYEFVVKHNLCASCASTTTTADLMRMAGGAKAEEYLTLDLDYTQNPGHPQLREEISKLYQSMTAKNIQVTTGASEAIFLLMNVLLKPGDNVVVLDPVYQSLFEVAVSIGAEVRHWQLNGEEFAIDLQRLPKLIDDRTKMVVVNYPHSPTGAMITKEQQLELVQIVEQHGCYLVSDEVYAGIVYNQLDLLPRAADLSSLAISIGDFAKPWGMGGLRIGWLASQQLDLLAECSAMRDYTTMCNAAPAEFLATITLQHSDEISPLKISEARNNIETWKEFCQQHPGVFSWVPPKGGFSSFPRVELDVSVDDFCQRLAEEYSVLLMPGSAFGYDKHIRIGFGQSNQYFKAGLELLGKFIKSI
jgi:aspartate/methionine/tyrosine aminotransferase